MVTFILSNNDQPLQWKCDLLFNDIMWSAPGWWKLRPIRPAKEKKKKKKKHAFYKEGKTWNFLIKSQPVDRHSFWSSTVLCAMGKCQPGWAWHKQQTHLHNLVEWHKRQTQTTDAGKRGWDTHPFVVTYLICTHARANKTSYKAKNSSKLLWLQCAHVTRTIYLCFLGSKVSKWKTSWLSSFLYKKQTTKCTT